MVYKTLFDYCIDSGGISFPFGADQYCQVTMMEDEDGFGLMLFGKPS